MAGHSDESLRRRYALVGTGVRGLEMFGAPILGRYADVAELVAIADPNPLRQIGRAHV